MTDHREVLNTTMLTKIIKIKRNEDAFYSITAETNYNLNELNVNINLRLPDESKLTRSR